MEETLYLLAITGMEEFIEGGKTEISECLDECEVEW
jgi:hypothetical protein